MELKPKRVRHEAERSVHRITLSDPERQNALGTALLGDLAEAIDAAEADPQCRAIVLSATGDAFCAGLDLREALSTDPPSTAIFRMFADCLLRLCRTRCPVVAAVQARATGGGVGLVAAADIVIASERAEMILPEVIVGMIPAVIAPVLLRRLSPGRLRALSLGARALDASEALSIGLADEVVKADELNTAIKRQVGRLTRSSPEAIAQTKSYLDWLGDDPLGTSLDRAVNEIAAWLRRPQVIEGARAFADGLTPGWFYRQEGTTACQS